MEVDVYLAHFGVKGMKWGVRKSSTNRRAIAGTATVAGGAAGLVAGKKALESGSKFLTSQKLNDRLVNQVLKNQPVLIRKAAKRHVSKSISEKTNLLVSTLNSGSNRDRILAGSAIAGALLIGGATLATTHAVQNSRREREERNARRRLIP